MKRLLTALFAIACVATMAYAGGVNTANLTGHYLYNQLNSGTPTGVISGTQMLPLADYLNGLTSVKPIYVYFTTTSTYFVIPHGLGVSPTTIDVIPFGATALTGGSYEYQLPDTTNVYVSATTYTGTAYVNVFYSNTIGN